jgi:hypothetical protein
MKRRRRSTGKSKAEYFQDAVQKYMLLHHVTEFDPDEVAAWMVKMGLYEDRPRSAEYYCRAEIIKSLRAQHITDPQGREVRAMLGARRKDAQGNLFSTWAPLFQAKPDHARRSLQQMRRGARGEVLMIDRTANSYNDNNIHGAVLPLMDFDFNKDIAEDSMPPDYPDEKPND